MTLIRYPETPERRPSRTSLFFLISSLAGGNILSMLLRLGGSVLQARCIAPPVLGLFNGIGLVMGYAPVLHLGVLDGLGRELPHAVGKGNKQHAQELAAAAQAWAIAVGTVLGVALLLIAGWQLVHGKFMLASGWFTNAITGSLLFYSTYLQMTYRTSQDFARLAVVGVLGNIVALILVALVALWSFYGLCLRAIIVSVVGVILLYYGRPMRIGPQWNLDHLKHLLIIGAPILGVNYLYMFWNLLDSTLVLRYMGAKGMGLYAIVMMGSSSFALLPVAVEQVVYPRMAEQFGRTSQVKDLGPIWHKPMLLTFVAMLPLTIVGWWLVGPVVKWVAPAYVEAVPAIKWSLLLPLVSSFAPINSLYNVVRRQDLYVTAILVGMVAYGGSLMWLIRDDAMLPAFPQAMLVGRVVFFLLCLVFLRHLNTPKAV
jgi:O-antigen/teichoic acid export membrane protein